MNKSPILKAIPVLNQQDNSLYVENVELKTLVQQFGTPLYVYSKQMLTEAYQNYDSAFQSHDHLICYAVKANSNLAILNTFAKLGAGFDIVSGGELQRVLASGGNPKKVVFSGVGKTEAEMQFALEVGILCFNVESESELYRLNQVAERMGKIAHISLRVNPNVDAKTHPYISTGMKENKFGIAYEIAYDLYVKAHNELKGLKVVGIDCHIGSQLTEISPFADAIQKVLALVEKLNQAGIELEHIDIGGGVGIVYQDETPIDLNEYAQAILKHLGNRKETILIEPGRSLVGNSGILLTKVEYIKHHEDKHFAIIDGAMNDLLRPSLYEAYHEVLNTNGASQEPVFNYDLVGPVCESGDFLAKNRDLALQENDILAILSAGAYGMSMSSNYNSRPRPAEIMVDGNQFYLIRQREETSQLFSLEKIVTL